MELTQILTDSTVTITKPVCIEEIVHAWYEAEDANLNKGQFLFETLGV